MVDLRRCVSGASCYASGGDVMDRFGLLLTTLRHPDGATVPRQRGHAPQRGQRDVAGVPPAPPDDAGHHAAREAAAVREVALREYDAIRAEVLQALQGQQSILNFGASTISVLFVAAAALDGQGLAQVSILVLAVPLIAVLVLTLWSCELVRMRRAGTYLLTLETELNQLAGGPALIWERLVNPPAGTGTLLPSIDRLQRHVVTLTFALIATVSAASGTVYSVTSLGGLPYSLEVWLPVLSVLLVLLLGVAVLSRFRTSLAELRVLHRQAHLRRSEFCVE